jgi:hypothetical protein
MLYKVKTPMRFGYLRPLRLRWLDPGMLLTDDDPYVDETRVGAVSMGRIIGDDAALHVPVDLSQLRANFSLGT